MFLKTLCCPWPGVGVTRTAVQVARGVLFHLAAVDRSMATGHGRERWGFRQEIGPQRSSEPLSFHGQAGRRPFWEFCVPILPPGTLKAKTSGKVLRRNSARPARAPPKFQNLQNIRRGHDFPQLNFKGGSVRQQNPTWKAVMLK